MMRYSTAILLLLSQLLSLMMDGSLFARAGWLNRTPSWMTRKGGNKVVDIHRIYSEPTNRRRVVLQNRNQLHLIMKPESGRLMGTKNAKLIKRFGKFELQRYRPGVLRILNLRTRKYIAINKKGLAYATKSRSLDTLFNDTMVSKDGFYSYHSHSHRTVTKNGNRKWYLAIKKDGRLKRPSKALNRHRSIQFLPEIYKDFKRRTRHSH